MKEQQIMLKMLLQLNLENKDVTKVVTTLITNMDSLFKDKT